MNELFAYLQGYLIIELTGRYKERFINLCKNKNLELLQVYQLKEKWFCKLSCKDFFQLKDLLRKTDCKCKIHKKQGFPFLLFRLKRRKGICIGSILFLSILLFCTNRIWDINVEGGFLHTREQLLLLMEKEQMVYGGIPAKAVNCAEIEKRIRLMYNEIGWISIEKRGCRLFVMLNESTMPYSRKQLEYPCHIIADKDGIVQRIEVLSGIPMVKAGDAVKKGDVLICGVIPIVADFDEILRKEPVIADGRVYIKSEFSYISNFETEYEKKIYKNTYYGLEIFSFGRKLFSYIPRYSDGKYDIITNDIVPLYFEDYQVPILFRKYHILPYNTETVHMAEEEISEKAKLDWNAFLTDWEKQGVQIIDARYSRQIQGKRCYVSGTVTASGNFISYRKIQNEEWKTENEYGRDNP